MNPIGLLSLPVLGTALLVSSPALYRALVLGTTPPLVGLARFLVAVLVSWAAFGLLAMLVGPPPPPEKNEDEADRDTESENVGQVGQLTGEAAR
jgi:hypothetical protein